jgi:hypothetical protein
MMPGRKTKYLELPLELLAPPLPEGVRGMKGNNVCRYASSRLGAHDFIDAEISVAGLETPADEQTLTSGTEARCEGGELFSAAHEDEMGQLQSSRGTYRP